MKKSILATVLMVCITFTAVAQKKQKRNQKPQFTVEQQTTLEVKKLTLALDLTSSQQEKMYPLILDVNKKKSEMMKARKANKGEKPKLSSDEIYAKMIEKLDYQIAFKAKVKKILKEDQYEKWNKIKAKMYKQKQDKKGGERKGQGKGKPKK